MYPTATQLVSFPSPGLVRFPRASAKMYSTFTTISVLTITGWHFLFSSPFSSGLDCCWTRSEHTPMVECHYWVAGLSRCDSLACGYIACLLRHCFLGFISIGNPYRNGVPRLGSLSCWTQQAKCSLPSAVLQREWQFVAHGEVLHRAP
jgi:hypothetical protein